LSSKDAETPCCTQASSKLKKQGSVEKEVKFKLPPKSVPSSSEEDDAEAEDFARPPTPPRQVTKKSKQVIFNSI